jgi:hypothetical protein
MDSIFFFGLMGFNKGTHDSKFFFIEISGQFVKNLVVPGALLGPGD